MSRIHRATSCALFMSLALLLGGMAGCPTQGDPPMPEPEDPTNVVKLIEDAADVGQSAIGWVEDLAVLLGGGNFHACHAAEIGDGGLGMVKSNAPEIWAEHAHPDGKIEIVGFPLDFARCHDMPGKPDGWPMVETDPAMVDLITGAVGMIFGYAADWASPSLPGPDAGAQYIGGRVFVGVLDAVGDLCAGLVRDAITGAEITEIPTFVADYSDYYNGVGPDSLIGVDVTPAIPMHLGPCAGEQTNVARSMCEMRIASAELGR